MAEKITPEPKSAIRSRGGVVGRQYSPLLAIVIAFLVMILIMPSALNLPQANPSTVLEYAPIPPDEDTPPQVSESGSFASLGLGVSGGTGAGEIGTGTGTVSKPGRTRLPQGKRCVGSPPRQTEDPMSPPCVATFSGDNGGRTHTGVTKDEIVVIVYLSTGGHITSGEARAEGAPPSGTFCEVDAPPGNCQGPDNEGTEDHVQMRVQRMLSRFFNNRFQTYNRHVRMILHYSNAANEQLRRRDAAEQYALYKPFAVVDLAPFGGFHEVYTDAMAARDVSLFSSIVMPMGDFLRAYAPNVWNFWPDAEHVADSYASYVCMKVKPFKVSQSDNPGENGQERKYGLMYTTDGSHEELIVARQLIKKRLAGCGLKWETEVTFPVAGFSSGAGDQSYAHENVAELRRKGVTTVLYLGGQEVKTSRVASAEGYLPEWVVLGDGDTDGNFPASFQGKLAWRNAWVTSFQLREDSDQETPAWQACKEANPSGRRGDCQWLMEAYRSHFMLFQAIQVAGPDLSPSSVDAGFHAIPRIRSTNPYQAAFYFDPGDYTGVKDAHEMWWDATANEGDGCYRLVRGAQRYPAWAWEGGHDVFPNPVTEPCSSYSPSVGISTGA